MNLDGPGYNNPFNTSPLKYIICFCFSGFCHLTILLQLVSLLIQRPIPCPLVSLTEYCSFSSAGNRQRSCLFMRYLPEQCT